VGFIFTRRTRDGVFGQNWFALHCPSEEIIDLDGNKNLPPRCLTGTGVEFKSCFGVEYPSN
jgi:hypothetical protein